MLCSRRYSIPAAIGLVCMMVTAGYGDINLGPIVNMQIGSRYPHAAFDDNGDLHVVTLSVTNVIYYRKYLLSQWNGVDPPAWDTSLPDVVPAPTQADWQFGRARIALDSAGNPHVVWCSLGRPKTGPIYYNRMTNKQWMPQAEYVSHGETNWSSWPDIAIDNSDNIHIAFVETYAPNDPMDGYDLICYVQRVGGQWLPPPNDPAFVISNRAVYGEKAGIGVNSKGEVYVAWYSPVGNMDAAEVFWRKKSGGVWGAIEQVTSWGNWAGALRVEVDDQDRVHIGYPIYSALYEVFFYLSHYGYGLFDGSQWMHKAVENIDIEQQIIQVFDVFPDMKLNDTGSCSVTNASDKLICYVTQGTNLPDEAFIVPVVEKCLEFPAVAGYKDTFYIIWEDSIGGIFMRTLKGQPQASGPPTILAGGYMDTIVTHYSGGELKFLLVVSDVRGADNIATVEMYFDGKPTGALFRDDGQSGDFAASDGVFGFTANFSPSDKPPQGLYLLEAVATNKQGYVSNLFPYLKIKSFDSEPYPDKSGNAATPENLFASQFRLPIDSWQQHYLATVSGMDNVECYSQIPPLNPPRERKGVPCKGGSRPFVNLAGYMDTHITTASGGKFNLIAWVTDPDEDVQNVEIFYDSAPTGVFLKDDGSQGDATANDSLYTLATSINPGAAPGSYLLEILARDQAGNESYLWPYLTITAGGTATPTPTPTATPSPTNPPGDLDCSDAVIIQCNSPYTGDSSLGSSDIDSYSCEEFDQFFGREVVHELWISDGDLGIELSGYHPKSLNFFLLSSCSENHCYAQGEVASAYKRTLTVEDAVAGRYFIVVDGYRDSDYGAYTLKTSCQPFRTPTATPTGGADTPTPTPAITVTITMTPMPGELDCSNPVNLSCGGVYSGNTANGNANVEQYGGHCTDSALMSGPEMVHALEIEQGSVEEITVTLTAGGADVDVFIIYGNEMLGCSEEYCWAWGDYEVTLPIIIGGTYYIVVDGEQETPASYTLQVTCR